MHTNPLLGLQAGFHQSPLAAQPSPLTSLFKLQEEQDEKEKLNEAIREQSKPHALNLLQQQQVQLISNENGSIFWPNQKSSFSPTQ